jgi:hypothetical protein
VEEVLFQYNRDMVVLQPASQTPALTYHVTDAENLFQLQFLSARVTAFSVKVSIFAAIVIG